MFSSPLSDYLNNNYVPPFVSEEQIAQILLEPQEAKRGLEAKIQDTKMALCTLQSRRDTLNLQVGRHKRMLARYFGAVSDEILSQIFTCTLPDDRFPTINPKETPLILSQVCRRWRFVSFRTPQLWAALDIPIPQAARLYFAGTWTTVWPHFIAAENPVRVRANPEDYVDDMCTMISQWLARSYPCLLSISFMADESTGPIRPFLERYLDIILDFSPRWRTLRLIINSTSILDGLASLSAHDVPNLQNLSLFVTRYQLSTASAWASNNLLRAPKLRKLHVTQNWDGLWNARLENLTHVSLTTNFEGSDPKMKPHMSQYFTITVTDAMELFLRCQSLVECHLELRSPRNQMPTAHFVHPLLPRVISLSFLAYFTLSCLSPDLNLLFSRLRAPALRTLKYQTQLYRKANPLVTLVFPHCLALQRLTIDLCTFSREELIICLNCTPLLTHFTHSTTTGTSRRYLLDSRLPFSIVDEFIKLITPPAITGHLSPRPPCLLPQLEQLVLKAPVYVTDTVISNFICSRLDFWKQAAVTPTPIPPLRSVEADIRHSVNDIRPFLKRRYKHLGLRLKIRYDPRPDIGKGFTQAVKKNLKKRTPSMG